MLKFIGATRYEAYVLGDLDKSEAKAFWQEELKDLEFKLACHNECLPSLWPDFETVYMLYVEGTCFYFVKH